MAGFDGVEMKILVIDDDPMILGSVGDFLKGQGYQVHLASSGTQGIDAVRQNAYDIVITDVQMPDVDGFEVLREVRRLSPGTETMIITGYRETENAFRAMQEGAFDFFTKPLKVQDLHASLQRTVRFRALRREKDRVQERLNRAGREARQRHGLSAIVGESPTIRAVRQQIRQVSESETTTVLISGETGAGKELVAQAIHYQSARAGAPFVAVDCSSVPEALFESAFYGHEKGAFTDAREARKGHFELADGGTLFLDEIGDMDAGMQVKLLRTLEERRVRPVGGSREIPVDVRVVSATNRDLQKAVAEGRFREDLLYRLNVFSIHAPSLRERAEDILPLAEHFLARYARELRRPIHGITPEAARLLEAHPFPGNVRELRNLMERVAILCRDGRVTPADLRFDSPHEEDATPGVGGASVVREAPRLPYGNRLEQVVRALPDEDLGLAAFEEILVREAFRRSEGNRAQTARLLGISRIALRSRIRKYGLSPEAFQDRDTEQ